MRTHMQKESVARNSLAGAVARTRPELEKQNREFAQMSRNQRRVQVAKDILMLLDHGKIEPCGSYVELPWTPESTTEKLPDLMRIPADGPCQVCAIGALFVAAAIRYSTEDEQRKAFPRTEVLDDDPLRVGNSIIRYLSRAAQLFSELELRCMEVLFEGESVFSFNCGEFTDIVEEINALGWHRGVLRVDKWHEVGCIKLRFLMQSIVDEGGAFVPRKVIDKLIPVMQAYFPKYIEVSLT